MLANNSKRIRHRKLTRGLYSGSDWRVRFEQNRCSSSGQNIEATKYHAKADQKNDSLLSSSARSTRIKRKKGAGGRGARGKETESDVEGEMGMGGRGREEKESNASGIEFEKTWTGRRNEASNRLVCFHLDHPHLRNGN